MEELSKLIPNHYAEAIRLRLSYERISELRIINKAPVRICYDGMYYFLCKTGITKEKTAAFVAGEREAEQVVMRACERSLYTVTDTLKRGYISVSGGLRVGVCGSGVMSGGEIAAVKDFGSVNIRIPHQIVGCASGLFAKVVSGGLKNTLIISPPGVGKTTVLRDLCRLVSDHGYKVLLCDEKHEVAAVAGGAATLDVGFRTDIISGVDKRRVFEMGIANMSPQIIFADELFEGDLESVARAATCGVAVVATVHAKDIIELKQKQKWKTAIDNKVFRLYAVVSGAPMRAVTVYEGAENER